jgi:flagellar protein FlbT
MGMVVELKDGEQILIGDCAVVNKENKRVRLYIEGNLPILRQKDALKKEDVDSPTKILYFALQNLYLSSNSPEEYKTYVSASKQLVLVSPDMIPVTQQIDWLVSNGEIYKALREARALLDA